ncbi:MAG TPA: hypothetical protein V6D09_14390 [Leptolyngbyaceae cyanobacterium]
MILNQDLRNWHKARWADREHSSEHDLLPVSVRDLRFKAFDRQALAMGQLKLDQTHMNVWTF